MLRLINRFIYRPEATFAPSNLTPAAFDLAYEAVSLTTADQLALWGWYLPAAAPWAVLLYCHGNAGDIRDWVQVAPPLLQMGCSVLLFDYRGYGQSAGRPSEEGLYLDGEAAWAWTRERARQEGLPAVILGKSLGTAVALHAAAQASPAALILDSAFASMREIAMIVTPWLPDPMFPNLYESERVAPRVTAPTLVLHGRADTLVPLSHGQRIFAALGAVHKHLHIIDDAGHNDLSGFPDYHTAIQDFLNQTIDN